MAATGDFVKQSTVLPCATWWLSVRSAPTAGKQKQFPLVYLTPPPPWCGSFTTTAAPTGEVCDICTSLLTQSLTSTINNLS